MINLCYKYLKLIALVSRAHFYYYYSYAGESFDDISIDSAVAFTMLAMYIGVDDQKGKYFASLANNIMKVNTTDFTLHSTMKIKKRIIMD